MAQKASPYAIRLGYNQVWKNYFFPDNNQEQINYLKKDKLIRSYLKKLFPDIAELEIEYTKKVIFIYLHIPEVSLVLGENNEKLDKLMKELYKIVDNPEVSLKLNLVEVKNIYTHAQSISNLIASQLKKRTRSNKVIRDLLKELAKEREVKGVKIEISGRLDESDNAQTKKVVHEKMPLSTIDSNVGVGRAEAIIACGVIGVKVLVYKGKIWQTKKIQVSKRENYDNFAARKK